MSIGGQLSADTRGRMLLPAAETIAALTCGGLLAVIYAHTAEFLAQRWNEDPAWVHGYAVVGAFPCLVRNVWKRTQSGWPAGVTRRDCATGLITVLSGLVLHFVGYLDFHWRSFDAAGFVILLLGSLWMFGGQDWARRFTGCVLFLFFMVPWPYAWQQPLAESLQHSVSIAASGLLSLLSVPVHRVGYLLMLPDQTVEVAEGCSGMRQVMVFMALSAFFGLLSGNRVRCVALLVMSLPVAFLANTLRITATGLILYCFGSTWTQGVLHEVEGLLTFAIGLSLLWVASRHVSRWGLPAGFGKRQVANASIAGSPDSARAIPMRIRLTMLALMLAIGAGVDWSIQRAIASEIRTSEISLARPLATLPTEFGDWIGSNVPIQNSTFLYGDEHLHREYRHRATGQTLMVWLVYTADGRDRAHHPEICMRVIGCAEERELRTALPITGHDQPAQRFFFRQPNGRSGQCVYHWYYVFREPRDQPPTLWRRLLDKAGRPPSGMTIEIFAPQLAESDASRADEFARQIDRELQSHLPEHAVRGSSRGPYLIVEPGRIVADNGGQQPLGQ